MTEEELRIFKRYSHDLDYYRLELRLAKLLLQDDIVKRSIERYGWDKIYIHGTDFLGHLTYDSLKRKIKVLGIVDNNVDNNSFPEIAMITDEVFFLKKEKNIPVVITELKDAKTIYKRLSEYLDIKYIYYLSELFEEKWV